MARGHECDRCGVAGCDLPDGVDLDEYFERADDGTGDMTCPGCRGVQRWEQML